MKEVKEVPKTSLESYYEKSREIVAAYKEWKVISNTDDEKKQIKDEIRMHQWRAKRATWRDYVLDALDKELQEDNIPKDTDLCLVAAKEKMKKLKAWASEEATKGGYRFKEEINYWYNLYSSIILKRYYGVGDGGAAYIPRMPDEHFQKVVHEPAKQNVVGDVDEPEFDTGEQNNNVFNIANQNFFTPNLTGTIERTTKNGKHKYHTFARSHSEITNEKRDRKIHVGKNDVHGVRNGKNVANCLGWSFFIPRWVNPRDIFLSALNGSDGDLTTIENDLRNFYNANIKNLNIEPGNIMELPEVLYVCGNKQGQTVTRKKTADPWCRYEPRDEEVILYMKNGKLTHGARYVSINKLDPKNNDDTPVLTSKLGSGAGIIHNLSDHISDEYGAPRYIIKKR